MILHRVFCVLMAAWAVYGDPGIESEHLEEDLVIRPLKDGRLGARFSFVTTLEGTSPRNPESLGGDDDCMFTRPRVKMRRTLNVTALPSPTLYPFPSHSRTDPSGIRNHRTASLFERG